MGGGGGQCIGSRRGGTTGSRWGVLRNCDDGLVFVYSCFLYHAVATRPWEPFSVPTPCLPSRSGSFLTILCADAVAHATPFTSLTLPPTSLFILSFGRFWSCRTAACKVVLGCSPSTVACLSPNVQLLSLQYFIFRRISYPSHNLAVPWRSTLNIGKALVLESLGNERIKHRHRNCSCGPGLRRLYLPYAASAGRLTSSGCPKIAISDLERSQVARDSN